MERVRIFWSGPYSIDSAIENFQGYEDFGIYMITRVWANSENLLYIGQVYGLKYWRSFADRLREHKWIKELRGKIRVRIGKITLGGNRKISAQRTNDVETLLIYIYKPPYNTQSTSWYYGREMKIINSGRRGPLKDEIYSEDYFE
jgi:hypothetical protein